MRKNEILPSLSPEVEDINRTRSTIVFRTDKAFASAVAGRTKPYKSIPKMFKPALEQTAEYIRHVMIPRIFEKEGPGWRPLAPRTVGERIALGFGGEHPILYRRGDLFRSLTDRTHPEHIEIIKLGRESRIEIGSSSKKFIDNHLGRPSQNLPARSMLPGVGGNAFPMGDRLAIERIFKQVKDRNKR